MDRLAWNSKDMFISGRQPADDDNSFFFIEKSDIMSDPIFSSNLTPNGLLMPVTVFGIGI